MVRVLNNESVIFSFILPLTLADNFLLVWYTKDGYNAEKRKARKQLHKSIKKLQRKQEEVLQVVICIDQQVVATYGDSLPAAMFAILDVVPNQV